MADEKSGKREEMKHAPEDAKALAREISRIAHDTRNEITTLEVDEEGKVTDVNNEKFVGAILPLLAPLFQTVDVKACAADVERWYAGDDVEENLEDVITRHLRLLPKFEGNVGELIKRLQDVAPYQMGGQLMTDAASALADQQRELELASDDLAFIDNVRQENENLKRRIEALEGLKRRYRNVQLALSRRREMEDAYNAGMADQQSFDKSGEDFWFALHENFPEIELEEPHEMS